MMRKYTLMLLLLCVGTAQAMTMITIPGDSWAGVDLAKLTQSANAGDVGAQDALGKIFFNGHLGVKTDQAKGFAWFQKAAQGGYWDAMVAVGELYAGGNGVAQDLAQARAWFAKAKASAPTADDRAYVDKIAAQALGTKAAVVPKSTAHQAPGLLHSLGWMVFALGGDTEAMRKIGFMYYYGAGVEKDYAQAVAWFRKAAEQGDAAAQNNLGAAYYYGEGVEKDYAQAIAWYRKAAEQGDAVAQKNLGDAYYDGEGVEKDYAQAVAWFRKAAGQGNATAQNNLGNMYDAGHGVAKDYAQAVAWYRKAAEQGDAAAQNNLGAAYYSGEGVEKDYAQAVAWFRKAAEQGNVMGQKNLEIATSKGHQRKAAAQD